MEGRGTDGHCCIDTRRTFVWKLVKIIDRFKLNLTYDLWFIEDYVYLIIFFNTYLHIFVIYGST